jgi:uncharacterized protein YjcR
LAQQGNGLIRTDILQKLGKYTLLPAGDTEFYFRIGAYYNIHFIDKLYHYHRIWSQSFVRTQVLLSGKAEKNLYDVKQAIFSYYLQQNKITKQEYKLFSKQNIFEYNRKTLVIDFKQKKYLLFIKKTISCFIQFPIKTLKFFIKNGF